MHKNVLICWMFGEIELTLDELFNYHDHVVINMDDKELTSMPDWFRVISGASADADIESIREIAKADFVATTLVQMEEAHGH